MFNFSTYIAHLILALIGFFAPILFNMAFGDSSIIVVWAMAFFWLPYQIILILLFRILNLIYATLLYEYATTGKTAREFPSALIEKALR